MCDSMFAPASACTTLVWPGVPPLHPRDEEIEEELLGAGHGGGGGGGGRGGGGTGAARRRSAGAGRGQSRRHNVDEYSTAYTCFRKLPVTPVLCLILMSLIARGSSSE